jgi:TolB-like protein/DNA-binding winged helix-turn-helix (wHTH) protein
VRRTTAVAFTLPSDPPSVPIRFGAFEVNLKTRELRKKGLKVRLEGQPFEVLRLLLEHPGQLVTREDLQRQLWPGDTFVDFETSINAAVKRLRQALGDSADTPRFIETLPRRGYRFIQPITREAPAEALRTGGWQRRWWLAPVAGVLVVLIAAMALNIAGLRDRVFGRDVAVRRIGVLPPKNLTGDKEQEYLVGGIHDDLITRLWQVGGLNVISRTTMLQLADSKKSLREIAREVNADALLEGSVQRSGDRIYLNLQLISPDRDDHLWADVYDRDLRDIQRAPVDAARAIAQQLGIEVSAEANSRWSQEKVVDPEAFLAYFRGTHHAAKMTNPGLREAIRHFQDATDAEPTYAPAWAGMGAAYLDMSWSVARPETLPRQEALSRARAALANAIAFDPSLREPHQVLGRMKLNAWDWAGASSEFEQAHALDANWEGPSLYLLTAGRFDDAVAAARRGAELDPLGYDSQLELGWIYFMVGRIDESITQVKKAIDLEPRIHNAHFELAWNYARKGMHPEAVNECDMSLALLRKRQPEAITAPGCGWVYALAGRRSEALKIAGALDQDHTAEGGLIHRSHIYDALGDRTNALATLARAYEEREPNLPRQWFSPMVSDGLRADPTFQDLVRKTGIPWARFTPLSAARGK